MPNTTNYGWATPADTDLVKDGAAAIRTLGSSADTTTKNLNPETTLGDISFRSSTSNVNTRVGIGSSGQFLSVVGGVPAWATATDQTPLTTKGDIFTFSTVDARLAVGATNGMVLTVDSAEATGLKYATPASGGGFTTISTASVTGSSQAFTSIANTFKHLVLVIQGVFNNSANFPLNLSVNSISSQTYTYDILQDNAGTVTGVSANDDTQIPLINMTASNNAQFALNGQIWFYNYATSGAKNIDFKLVNRRATQGFMCSVGQGYNTTSSAISTITLSMGSGTFQAGTMTLYGVS